MHSPRNPFTLKEPSLTATETPGVIPLTLGESLAVCFAILMPPSGKEEGSVQGTTFPSINKRHLEGENIK